MSFLRNFRSLGIYLVFVFIASISFHFILKLYFHYNYTPEKTEKLLSSVSSYRYYNDSPCAAAIYGDPVDAGLKYVKINLHCDRANSTTNTLDMRAIKEPTVKGALELLGNVNGFKSQISGKEIASLGILKNIDDIGWRCFSDGQEIKDFSTLLKEQQKINCFYNFDDLAIQKYNENN
jgi:hypothetical protein